jgi:hypothetical protein
MNKLIIIFVFAFSTLLANDVVHQRQESMQDFNKLMRSATQILKDGETEGLEDIYTKIESIMIEYPNLFRMIALRVKPKLAKILSKIEMHLLASLKIQARLAALAKIAASNNDLEAVQQHHQNLFGSCKSCHSRFKN